MSRLQIPTQYFVSSKIGLTANRHRQRVDSGWSLRQTAREYHRRVESGFDGVDTCAVNTMDYYPHLRRGLIPNSAADYLAQKSSRRHQCAVKAWKLRRGRRRGRCDRLESSEPGRQVSDQNARSFAYCYMGIAGRTHAWRLLVLTLTAVTLRHPSFVYFDNAATTPLDGCWNTCFLS
jgi:hypothetical protein